MTKKISLYLLLALTLCWISCSDGDDAVSELPSSFEAGVFVLNEGGFGSANASLSFLENGNIFNDTYFKSVSEDLGDVFQSAYLDGSQLHMVLNGSGAIKSVNVGAGLSSVTTISGLQQPRYLAVTDDHIYVTEWIAWGQNGQLSIIDKSSGTVTNIVGLAQQPEGLIEHDGQLLIANSGSGSVFVLDLTSGVIEDTISVGSSPSAFVKDAEGDIWVICAGGYDDSFNPLNDGELMELDLANDTISTTIELGMNVAGKIAINPAGDMIYYYTGTNVYAFSTSGNTAPASPLISEADAIGFYGIGVAPDGTIYMADAKDYVSEGEVFRYNPDGSAIDKFTVGIIPNGFVFK